MDQLGASAADPGHKILGGKYDSERERERERELHIIKVRWYSKFTRIWKF